MSTPEHKMLTGIPRPVLINELMKRIFPHFMSNEDTETKTHFLSTYLKCDFTDCYGDDAERECLVEKTYFESEKKQTAENTYYEAFGNSNSSDDENVVEHSML